MVLKNKQNKYENNKEGLQEQGRKKYRDLEIQKKKQKYRKKIYIEGNMKDINTKISQKKIKKI